MTITILTIIHVMICIFMIVIVLLQNGKGAGIGATFGGSSQALFGSEGPVPLLNKLTTMTAIVFMVTSLSLAYLSTDRTAASVMEEIAVPLPSSPQDIPLIDTPAPPLPPGSDGR
jgi:preprotein translocase subunit SecG